jgi:hypothetical protein
MMSSTANGKKRDNGVEVLQTTIDRAKRARPVFIDEQAVASDDGEEDEEEHGPMEHDSDAEDFIDDADDAQDDSAHRELDARVRNQRVEEDVQPNDLAVQRSDWGARDVDRAQGDDNLLKTFEERLFTLVVPLLEGHFKAKIVDAKVILKADATLRAVLSLEQPQQLTCTACKGGCVVEVGPAHHRDPHGDKGELHAVVVCTGCDRPLARIPQFPLPCALAGLCLEWPPKLRYEASRTHFEQLQLPTSTTDDEVRLTYERHKEGLKCESLDGWIEKLQETARPSKDTVDYLRGQLSLALQLVEAAHTGMKTERSRHAYASEIATVGIRSTVGMKGESPVAFRNRRNREIGVQEVVSRMNRRYGGVFVGNQHQILDMRAPQGDGKTYDIRLLEGSALLNSVTDVVEHLVPGEEEAKATGNLEMQAKSAFKGHRRQRSAEACRAAQQALSGYYERMDEDTRARFCHQSVRQPVVNKFGQPQKCAQLWLQSPQRLELEGMVVFDPRAVPGIVTDPGSGERSYNLWRGLAVQPQAGECGLIQAHIRQVLAAGHEETHEYLLDWIASMLQQPWKRLKTVLVFRGKQGAGKGVVCVEVLLRILGQHGKHLTTKGQLVGRFNSHLKDAALIVADEAFFSGDKEIKGQIKALCTEDTIYVEGKHKDMLRLEFVANLIFISNEQIVVAMDSSERRFVFLQVDDQYAGAHAHNPAAAGYFDKLYAEIRNGGVEAFLHQMLQRDVSKFRPQNIPKGTGTCHEKARFEHIRSGSDAVQRFWYERLREGQLLPRLGELLDQHRNADWADRKHVQLEFPPERLPAAVSFDSPQDRTTVLEDSLFEAYKAFCGSINERYKKSKSDFLTTLQPLAGFTRRKLNVSIESAPTGLGAPTKTSKRLYALGFPPLRDCRLRMEEAWKISALTMWQ